MIKLENHKIRVTIDEEGAQLTSIRGIDPEIEYLWTADPDYWKRHAPILFPIVGRLNNDFYNFDGKQYGMSQHGFARDERFSAEYTTANSVTLLLKSSRKTYRNYPFRFELRVTYTLTEMELNVNYQITNPVNSKMYFSIGAHPGFNVPLEGGDSFETTEVAVEPAQQYGRIKLVGPLSDFQHPTSITLDKPLQLHHELFNNDAVILQLDHPVQLTIQSQHSKHGVTVKIPEAPFVGIWSPYPKQAPFVCIEPWWGIADTTDTTQELTEKRGIIELEGRQSKTVEYQIKLF